MMSMHVPPIESSCFCTLKGLNWAKRKKTELLLFLLYHSFLYAHNMLKPRWTFLSAATILLTTAWTAMACEPECRHAISQILADRYMPVIDSTMNELQDMLSDSLGSVPVPEQLSDLIPTKEVQDGIQTTIEEGLEGFMAQLSTPTNGDDDTSVSLTLEEGIHQAMFSGDQPFKGDCNNPPRLSRKMPPAGEPWTRDECK